MKAIVVNKSMTNGLELVERNYPEITKGHAIIKIAAVSLNRRDYWCTVGKYPGIKNGIILGSDASGLVAEVGCNDGAVWLGKKVIINPVVKTLNSPIMPSLNYRLLGTPYDGTLTEYIKVPYERLSLIPSHLTDNEAACLPLAGLTAYNAVFSSGKIGPYQRVLITGIGGGVAQFAAQFSQSAGAIVNVTTGSESKMELAKKIGYKSFNYNDKNFINNICKDKDEYYDAIVDGTGGDYYPQLMRKLKIFGSMISYGATAGQEVSVNLPALFFGQYRLIGCTMGSDQDFRDMVKFVDENQIVPIINSVSFSCVESKYCSRRLKCLKCSFTKGLKDRS